MQKLADFIREGASQFFRFAARSDRFTDAQNSLIAVAVALRRNDRDLYPLALQSPHSPVNASL